MQKMTQGIIQDVQRALALKAALEVGNDTLRKLRGDRPALNFYGAPAYGARKSSAAGPRNNSALAVLICPARLFLAPQPERAACPVRVRSCGAFFSRSPTASARLPRRRDRRCGDPRLPTRGVKSANTDFDLVFSTMGHVPSLGRPMLIRLLDKEIKFCHCCEHGHSRFPHFAS
jgi:hypothetical protein